ncbi:DNA-directed DNA polymerase delta, partial [Conglomerata obtusa]
MAQNITFLQTHISYYQDTVRNMPMLEIFGSLPCGKPICCHLSGVIPYFYVEHTETNFSDLFLEKFLTNFNDIYKKTKLLKVEKCQKQTILGYTNTKKTFLKLYFDNPTNFAGVKTFLESGMIVLGKRYRFKIFESNVAFVMRFMIDYDITGMCYMRFKHHESIENVYCYSIKANVNDLIVVKGESEFNKLPKLKILSFDIECIGKGDAFPNAKEDPVIQIGNTICYSNTEEVVQKDIFCLKKCGLIPGANVHSFENENDLLLEWSKYFVRLDPDIITGYNIKNFDFPYLLERAEKLKLNEFSFLARKAKIVKAKDQFFSSRQIGSRASKDVEIDGRIIFDMFHVIRKDFNLRSYTLNSVSIHFLGEQKEDVPYSSMRMLQEGDEETRKRIATYCLKDTMLPLRLLFKLNVLANYTEMSRVTGVPIEYLSSRGQAIKVMSQILRRAKQEDYVVPTLEVFDNERTFEGGFVMDPIKGYYNNPISVLDFSSLYPSIMIVNNLCYTTLIDRNTAKNILNKENLTDKHNDEEKNKSNEAEEKEEIENRELKELKYLKNNTSVNKKAETAEESSSFSFMFNQDKNSESLNQPNENKRICVNKSEKISEMPIENSLTADQIITTPTKNYFVKKTVKLGLLPKIL